MTSMTGLQFMVRLPHAVIVGLDQEVEARRGNLEPATRSSLVREIVTAHVRNSGVPASAPVRRINHGR